MLERLHVGLRNLRRPQAPELHLPSPDSPSQPQSFREFQEQIKLRPIEIVSIQVRQSENRVENGEWGSELSLHYQTELGEKRLTFSEPFGFFTHERIYDTELLRCFITAIKRTHFLFNESSIAAYVRDGSYPRERMIDVCFLSRMQKEALEKGVAEPFPLPQS